MDVTYPPGPAAVPPDLTQPTSAYKRHAWLAMLGLAGFITLYFALSAWFAWTAWRLLGGMFGPSGNFELWGFVAGICAAFLAVFMLKALFFLQHRYEIEDLEITRAQEPQLFEFIDRLADEARAPRAHKVYLSPSVNAAVFYDLSLLNLIIPSKKNLEIGLGLVNVLSLGEFKAVLAHEFGHFAQRSMAVGRWVYVARQIAGHVVARRDALDKLLKQLSRFDLRVAWVGWLLSIIVWSIRSMMDVLFKVVLLAERALSRQMEFQADLVAVSLTGSDALIHALHRLHSADDAWDKALAFANSEAGKQRRVTDLFAVQTRIIDRMREILGQPTYGVVPPVPDNAPHAHRLFKSALAQAPRMWSTHPASADREQNAKQRYVPAAVDARSAWDLFADAPALREKMSAHVFRNAEKLEPTEMATTLENLAKNYGRPFLDRKYRGIYLGRSPVHHSATVAGLYGPAPAAGDLIGALDALYPESLADRIERLNEKLEQKYALEALRDQVAEAPGGIIHHNGVKLRRKDLPNVIAQLTCEADEMRSAIEAHDRDCRTAHLAAARTLGKGWPEYLQGLAATLHYADHSEANLRDAQGYVINIYNVVTADGRVSSAELSRLVAGCQELYRPLQVIYGQRTEVTLDRTLLRRMEVESWAATLEDFKLPGPDRENISQWIGVIDSWVGAALHALSSLRVAALEQLLLAESQVARFVREKMPAADAPPPGTVPREYATRLPGTERPRQKRLDWWDRFQTADGVLPMIARSAVAVGVVGGVVVLSGFVGASTLSIYNGLAVPVLIEVNEHRERAGPHQALDVSVPSSGSVHVRTLTLDERVIESFDEKTAGTNVKYIYNVAGAVPLVEWTAEYHVDSLAAAGSVPSPTAPADRPLGAARWSTTHVDYVFKDPPQSIKMGSKVTAYRDAVRAEPNIPPWRQAELVSDGKFRADLILAHVRWDDTNTQDFSEWLALGASQPEFGAVLAQRLEHDPADVVLLRFQQDSAEGAKHDEVCARHRAQAAAAPSNADLQYLAIRCLEDGPQQDAAFYAAQKQWPQNPWLALAVAHTHAVAGEYSASLGFYEQARQQLPSVGEYLVITTARVRRLADDRELAQMSDLLRASQMLQMFAAIETGTDVLNTPLEPFANLARGDLAAATQAAQQHPEIKRRLLPLLAASDGATPQMISDALALPIGESPDIETMFAMYGVAARAGRNTAPYAAEITRMLQSQSAPVMAFLDSIRRGTDPARALAALPGLELRLRLQILNAAVVILGPRAPPAWREDVSRGLFVSERGYYGAVQNGHAMAKPRGS